MGADSFIVFFGLRYTITSAEEQERLAVRDDPRLLVARRARLQTYWGRETEGEPMFLLIGTEIGRFGVENMTRADVSASEIAAIIEETHRKLRDAGLEGEAKLQFQLDADY